MYYIISFIIDNNIFIMYSRVIEEPALGYMQIVPRRNAATLLPIIQQHVAPGTKVRSDELAAYNRIISLPNVTSHNVVNHSIQFVTPDGMHIQNAESSWNRGKIKLKECVDVMSTKYQATSMNIGRGMWRTAKQCLTP